MRKPALLAALALVMLAVTTEPAVAKRGDETGFSGLVDIGNGRTMYLECILVPQPTSASDGAADLRLLLSAAGEPGPYVVVAHSWGGLMARLFASRNPDDVAGLVLLDPGSEFLQTYLAPEQWAKFVQGAKTPGEPTGLEAADYEPSVAALRSAPPVRAIPAVVLTSDEPFDFGASGADTWPAWLAAQEAVATLLGARHVTRTNSGHFIQGEQPKRVVKAIRRVIEAACRGCTAVPCEGAPHKKRQSCSPGKHRKGAIP